MLAWFFPKVWKNVPNQQPIWTMSIIEGTKWCFFTATMKDYAWDGLRWPETAESQIRKLFYFEWSPPWQTMMRIIERHHWNKWSTCCDCCHASAVITAQRQTDGNQYKLPTSKSCMLAASLDQFQKCAAFAWAGLWCQPCIHQTMNYLASFLS